MRKSVTLKKIQERLPEDIEVRDLTKLDFTEDEYISILSWIKFFNIHYKENGKVKDFPIQLPFVSKRIVIDFALYRFPSDQKGEEGRFLIYIKDTEEKSLKNLILRLDR